MKCFMVRDVPIACSDAMVPLLNVRRAVGGAGVLSWRAFSLERL